MEHCRDAMKLDPYGQDRSSFSSKLLSSSIACLWWCFVPSGGGGPGLVEEEVVNALAPRSRVNKS